MQDRPDIRAADFRSTRDLSLIEESIEFATKHKSKHFDASGDKVVIGHPSELSREEHSRLESILLSLGPWRKGPFEIFGHPLYAHWKSERKWERVHGCFMQAEDSRDIFSHRNLRIADVGAGNGYYMFRMQSEEPALVDGFDPQLQFADIFNFLYTLHPHSSLRFYTQGYEALKDKPKSYDRIYLMGILYHHTDPYTILKLCHAALDKGGELVLEGLTTLPSHIERFLFDHHNREPVASFNSAMKSVRNSSLLTSQTSPLIRLHSTLREMIVPISEKGERSTLDAWVRSFPEDAYSLCPGKVYAGMKSVWSVPSPLALLLLLERAGFKECAIRGVWLDLTEQERTSQAPFPSIREYLQEPSIDLSDKESFDLKTKEGYPFPYRIHIRAKK